jgi:hypothetical protein
MKWWADWLVDNPRDHARCPGLTDVDRGTGILRAEGVWTNVSVDEEVGIFIRQRYLLFC